MQVSYNRLKNPSKNLWCNCQAKRDRQKLVNFVVPDKSEKFPGSQRNYTSFPRFPVFGGTLQDRFRSDFSPRGKISVTLSENSYFQQQSLYTELEKELGEAKLHLS
jgi:hypothetical protein